MKHYIVCQTTLATFTIVEENEQIIGIQFGNQAISEESTPLLLEAKKQIEEYIDGKRNTFSLPYHYQGSPFQNQVWKVIESIPYGQTLTYQEIAKKMGKPKAYRAVGNALNKNPLPILVPCHRVVGSNHLGGYAGSYELKIALLTLEKTNLTY